MVVTGSADPRSVLLQVQSVFKQRAGSSELTDLKGDEPKCSLCPYPNFKGGICALLQETGNFTSVNEATNSDCFFF